MIPKIIHQLYLSKDKDIILGLDLNFKYSKTLQELNPNFQYLFWSEQRIKELLDNPEYQRFKSLYETLPEDQQILIACCLILHQYGGFYFDLRIEMLAPLPEELHKRSLWLVNNYKGEPKIIASEQGHSYWLQILNQALKNSETITLQHQPKAENLEAYQDILYYNPELISKVNFNSGFGDFLIVIIILAVLAFCMLIIIIILAIILNKKYKNI